MKMIVTGVLALALSATLVASPAFAACSDEIDVVITAFESSELDDATDEKVSDAIDLALQNSENDDEDACLAAVDEAKAILNIE